MKKRLFKLLIIALCAIALIVIAGLVAGWLTEFRPQKQKAIDPMHKTADRQIYLPDTVRILSWNIGYAGLGDDMDFFADGGKQVRTSKKRTSQNLDAIKKFISQFSNYDLIILQEVDLDSKRSYHINEFEDIMSALPDFFAYHSLNYSVNYVPVPLRNPMGKVRSGLALFTRIKPAHVVRYQYPGSFPFPVRLFNLKRCMLAAFFPLPGGGQILIGNTHNSAFDNGSMRRAELRFIDSLAMSQRASVVIGDWNCTPPSYTPTSDETNNKYFSPLPIIPSDFNPSLRFIADFSSKSMRFCNNYYTKGLSTESILDFVMCNYMVNPIEIKTYDMEFKNSDHNPISFKFTIKSMF